MKLLIALKSCAHDRDRGAHQLIRDTWGKDAVCDLKFFTGCPSGTPESDEIIVNAPDDYKGLPFKTREICRYALKNGYDYLFCCDTGSFVIPHHLVMYDFEKHDYLGYWGLKNRYFPFDAQDAARHCASVHIEECYPWASGGGYYLSRKAMNVIENAEPWVWAEDLWVGQELARKGIFIEDRAKAGYKGYIVDWIHNENNYKPNSMDLRREWMIGRYNQARDRCRTESCAWPSMDRNQICRGGPDPGEIDRIIEERREERRRKSQ